MNIPLSFTLHETTDIMKKYITYILAVLSLFTAMSITSSCCRENYNPDNDLPEVQDIPELDLRDGTILNAYYGDKLTIEFSSIGEPWRMAQVSVETSGCAVVMDKNLDSASGNGTVTILVSKEGNHSEGEILFRIKDGNRERKYTYTVIPYFLTVTTDDIVLSGEKGATASAAVPFETNVPGFTPAVSADCPWLSLAYGTLTALEENRTGTERDAQLTVSDPEGHFDPAVIRIIQQTLEPYYVKISVRDITLGGEAGSSAEIDYTVETNIPDFVPAFFADAAWLNVTDGKVTATEENASGTVREASVTVSDPLGRCEPAVAKVSQETLPLPPVIRTDVIQFAEWPFKNACLGVADADGDGEVSFDEALVPTELVAQGKGIHDLTGLEYFKNLRHLDLNGNDIVNADMLKELPMLYWLDLRGNPRLEHFDVTGCSVYFERCLFDITPDLHYTCWRGQIGVTMDSDQACTRSLHVRRNDVTTDWSRQDNLVPVQMHTKGDGGVAVVLTGLGFVQRDIEDGSFHRMMRDAMDLLFLAPSMAKYKEYMDIYYMEHMFESQYQYVVHYDDLFEKETQNIKNKYNTEERLGVVYTAYDKLFGSPNADKKLFVMRTDICSNLLRYGFTLDCNCESIRWENMMWYEGRICNTYTEYSVTPEERTYRRDYRPTLEGRKKLGNTELTGVITSSNNPDGELQVTVNFINTVFNENFVYVID